MRTTKLMKVLDRVSSANGIEALDKIEIEMLEDTTCTVSNFEEIERAIYTRKEELRHA